ncbi:MAG: hypothetical protein ABI556_03585 [Gemmatimonadales bacterium]
MPIGNLTSRERRTIWIGVAISVLALFVAFVGAPYARRWSAREELIASGADRIARLGTLIADESRLRQALLDREVSAGAGRLISGRTQALAGSALQGVIQNYAARSRMTITRFDLAGSPDSSGAPLPAIPASLSAIGDVYGVSEFLSLLQNGAPVVETRELTLVSNSSLRAGLLQLSVTLRAPAVIE